MNQSQYSKAHVKTLNGGQLMRRTSLRFSNTVKSCTHPASPSNYIPPISYVICSLCLVFLSVCTNLISNRFQCFDLLCLGQIQWQVGSKFSAKLAQLQQSLQKKPKSRNHYEEAEKPKSLSIGKARQAKQPVQTPSIFQVRIVSTSQK